MVYSKNSLPRRDLCSGIQIGSHKVSLSFNQSTDSTGGSIFSECRLGKWSCTKT